MANTAALFNLLVEPIIRIRRAGKVENVSLPELYEAMMADEQTEIALRIPITYPSANAKARPADAASQG